MSDLPSFRHPPVAEVVISARFERPARCSLPALGELAQRLGEGGFNTVEERLAYEAPVESFGHGTEPNGGLSLEVQTGVPPVRYWFLNEVGDELLQVQPNWFAANWRKVKPEAQYVRWEARWSAFSSWLSVVEEAIADDALAFDQVGVTYLNHIEPQGVWNDHGDAHAVFRPLAQAQGSFLDRPEQHSTDLKFVMGSTETDEPLGRLHVTIQPGFRQPAGTPVFVMNLTARGAPIGSGIDGVRGFADLAHEWVVRGFTDLTTDAMHTAWKRES